MAVCASDFKYIDLRPIDNSYGFFKLDLNSVEFEVQKTYKEFIKEEFLKGFPYLLSIFDNGRTITYHDSRNFRHRFRSSSRAEPLLHEKVYYYVFGDSTLDFEYLGCYLKNAKTSNPFIESYFDADREIAYNTFGTSYFSGSPVKQNFSLAFRFLKQASSLGHFSATLNLGVLYERGLGTYKNASEALKCYQKVARACNDQKILQLAQYHKARCYFEGIGCKKRRALAMDTFEQLAIKGLPEALFALAVIHENGLSTKKKSILAFEYYQLSFSKGLIASMYEIGRLYLVGKMVKKNFSVALYWFQNAAKNECPKALNLFGTSLINLDHYVPSSIKKIAFRYFSKAASLGYPPAMINLAKCYHSGIGTRVDRSLAFAVFKKAEALQPSSL